MKVSDVLNCSLPKWYPDFKKITIKSQFIPLPQEFLDYLNTDGVVLPERNSEPCMNTNQDEDNIVGEDLNINWDSDVPGVQSPQFLQLDAAVLDSVKALGGVVFPKLNWSAPRDAIWIAFDRTLKCKSPNDIYLLLKSSEFISYDLTQPFTYCDDVDVLEAPSSVTYYLVLRKWLNLNPGYEFRCFVKDNSLIGISQRNHSAFYDFIGKEKDDIISDVQEFFERNIHLKFPNQNYVFDVYRQEQGNLLLVDFNPFGEMTDALLFKWEELESNDDLQGTDSESVKVPAFRYVPKSEGVQPNPLLSQYGVPRDFLDLATGNDSRKLMDLLQLSQRQQTEEESSSDEESEMQNSIRQFLNCDTQSSDRQHESGIQDRDIPHGREIQDSNRQSDPT